MNIPVITFRKNIIRTLLLFLLTGNFVSYKGDHDDTSPGFPVSPVIAANHGVAGILADIHADDYLLMRRYND